MRAKFLIFIRNDKCYNVTLLQCYTLHVILTHFYSEIICQSGFSSYIAPSLPVTQFNLIRSHMKLKVMRIHSAVMDKNVFLLRPITFPTVTIDQLATDISNATSLTKSDVLNCLQSMSDYLSTHILAGNICDLGDFGIIKVNIKAKAIENGSYDIRKLLKYLHYQFTARTEIKDVLKTMPLQITEVSNWYNGEDGNVVTEE